MCGIAGFSFKNNRLNRGVLIRSFMESLKHRGPDDRGYTVYKGCALANTRLSIIDLGGGHQPVFSDDGSVVIVQNGEIYNYIEIRKDLEGEGVAFKTQSDTETILQAYLKYGVEFISKLNGMFAIAILDKRLNKLFLIRDRLGVKPLYIYRREDEILFASEIKTFLKYPDFKKEINYQAIHNYLVFNYVPLPETIFKNVIHVKPGTYISINLSTNDMEEYKYWRLENTKEDLFLNEEAYIELIDTLLKDATAIRLRSDVPFGAFLSGGLDSSTVCAIASRIYGKSFNVFSIGFREPEFDESGYAREVSELYSLDHKIKIVESDIINLWQNTTWFSDQPHGDISFIPTYILSEFAAKENKVVLTGDGGDELFAGYTKYFALMDHSSGKKEYFDSISLFKEDDSLKEIYSDSMASNIMPGSGFKLYMDTINEVSKKDDINKALFFDVVQLLPGNNLIKADKMAMANSLETRSPFLDYRLYELLFKIPGHFKLREKETKYILKKLALKYLPNSLVYRKKQMFTVPVGEWFKDKLKGYLLEMLDGESFCSRGLFIQNKITSMVHSHLNGKINYTRELRALVNLEIWFRKFIDTRSS